MNADDLRIPPTGPEHPAELPVEAGPPPGRPTSARGGCPMCGGALVALRGFQRCVRCAFALCQGCETPEVFGWEADG